MKRKLECAEYLLDEIGNIDDRLISDALAYRAPRRVGSRGMLFVAACVAIIAALVLGCTLTLQIAQRADMPDGGSITGNTSRPEGTFAEPTPEFPEGTQPGYIGGLETETESETQEILDSDHSEMDTETYPEYQPPCAPNPPLDSESMQENTGVCDSEPSIETEMETSAVTGEPDDTQAPIGTECPTYAVDTKPETVESTPSDGADDPNEAESESNGITDGNSGSTGGCGADAGTSDEGEADNDTIFLIIEIVSTAVLVAALTVLIILRRRYKDTDAADTDREEP